MIFCLLLFEFTSWCVFFTLTVVILLDVSVDLCFITSWEMDLVHYGQNYVDSRLSHHRVMSLLNNRFQISFLFLFIISSTLWRLSTRFWCIAVGICVHSAILVRSVTDVSWEGLGCSSSHRCWGWGRGQGPEDHSSSSAPTSANHVSIYLLLCTGTLSCFGIVSLVLLKRNCNATAYKRHSI